MSVFFYISFNLIATLNYNKCTNFFDYISGVIEYRKLFTSKLLFVSNLELVKKYLLRNISIKNI